MKSKTSFCNSALYKKNMTRFWPLWGLAVFFSVVYPLGHLIKVINYQRQNFPYTISTAYGLYEACVNVIPALYFIYAILVAMSSWSYLTSSRSVSLMHSIPVARKTLYFTNILSAMTMLVSPLIVFGVLYELIDISLGGGNMCALFIFWAVSIAEAVILYAVGTLAAMITGNILVLPALYVILNFLACGVEYIIEDFAKGFIFGYSGSYKGLVEFLSPFAFICNRLSYSLDESSSYVELKGAGITVIYGCIGIILLFLTYFIYKKRRSEAAGETICISFLKPVFTVIFSGSVAILLGRFIYYILGYSSEYYKEIPITCFVLFAGIMGYYGSSMMLKKTLAVFNKKSLPGLLATVGSLFIICFVSSLDPFNVENNIPSVNEVTQVTFSFSNNDLILSEEKGISMIEDLHKSIIDDRDLLLQSEEARYGGYYNCNFTYILKDGRKIERSYPFSINPDLPIANSECAHRLQELMENPYILSKNIENMETSGKINYISVWGEYVRGYAYEDSGEIENIFNAVKEDIANGNYSYSLYSNDDDVFIEFEIINYPKKDANNLSSYSYFKFTLTDDMIKTNEILSQYGWSRKDMIYNSVG